MILSKIKSLIRILAPCLALSGCYYLQPKTVPIGVIRYPHPEPQIAGDDKVKRLMVLLPGMGDRARVFAKHKLIAGLHDLQPSFDVIAVESHFKYYQDKSVIDRIHTDIVLPAIADGYQQIVMAGSSLGGLGSLLYLKEHPEAVSAVIVLAPYLGEVEEFQYLLDGSVRDEAAIKIDLWPWLTALPPEHQRKIFLAYGTSDKFSESNALLSNYLPESHTLTIDGNHRWITWKKLWPMVLCRMLMNKNVASSCQEGGR